MAKTPYQARLDGDLLAWARGYAKERGTTVTAIIEAGLRELQGLAAGGVPEVGVRAVKPQVGGEAMDARLGGSLRMLRAERPLSEHERSTRMPSGFEPTARERLMRERQARLNKRGAK